VLALLLVSVWISTGHMPLTSLNHEENNFLIISIQQNVTNWSQDKETRKAKLRLPLHSYDNTPYVTYGRTDKHMMTAYTELA